MKECLRERQALVATFEIAGAIARYARWRTSDPEPGRARESDPLNERDIECALSGGRERLRAMAIGAVRGGHADERYGRSSTTWSPGLGVERADPDALPANFSGSSDR
jgi:hypothetical protein